MASGRDLFKKLTAFIDIAVFLFGILPKPILKGLLSLTFGLHGKGGIFIRYCLVKNLAKSCGKNVCIKHNVELFNLQNLEIGDNVSIHPLCYIDAFGGVKIGNNVSIAHASSIVSFDHTYDNLDTPIKYNPVKKNQIVIKDDVWIGAGVRIIGNSVIESRCIIAAGAVVNRPTEPFSIYGGVPAKKIKEIKGNKKLEFSDSCMNDE